MMIKQDCRCCQTMSWHCEWCWNEHHNGLRDKDFKEKPDSPTAFQLEAIKNVIKDFDKKADYIFKKDEKLFKELAKC